MINFYDGYEAMTAEDLVERYRKELYSLPESLRDSEIYRELKVIKLLHDVRKQTING